MFETSLKIVLQLIVSDNNLEILYILCWSILLVIGLNKQVDPRYRDGSPWKSYTYGPSLN